MKSISKVIIILIIQLFFISCNITYFYEMSITDSIKLSSLDRNLLIKQNNLRKAQRAGTLNTTNGLFEVENLAGYMILEDNTAYIGFLGSDDIGDCYSDFSGALVTPDFFAGNGAKVHEGFFALFALCEVDINTWALDQQANGVSDFIILGHSMGGGIAPLCAAYLNEVLNPASNIYCQISGAPRSGNPQFVNYFDSQISCTRIVNGSDQLPSLPYKSLGYEHVGQYCHIGPEPNGLLASTFGWVSQHFIDAYVVSVE